MGSQFTAMVTGILVMAVLGLFNVHHHNTLNSAGVVLYAFTSCKWRLTGQALPPCGRRLGFQHAAC